MSTEPYGTTPLPAKGVSLRYDPGEVWEVAQQPKSQQIAAYEGIKNGESIHGATVLDVNQHFVIYAVKKGLIRILHRHSTLRTLFRGHEGQVVTDIRVFLDGDVIGSVGAAAGGASKVIIWRVFERTPEIFCEILLEISTSSYHISRLIWHPFNPNQFWILHSDPNSSFAIADEGSSRKVASLVDTTRISTIPHETEQHAVCMFHMPNIIMDGVVELSPPSASSLTDLDWSEKDVRHVLTTHQGGEIRLWDLRKVEPGNNNSSTMLPNCLSLIQEDQPLSRCKFLPHECPRDNPASRDSAYTNCFLTASNQNAVVTLWSPFGEEGTPTKLQVFGLEHPSPSYLLDVCYGPSPPDGPPPSLFVLMADQTEGKLFSWHLQSEWQEQTVVSLVGCDYVVPFVTSYPMYSWSTQVQPAADISEDELTDQGGLVFDMKLFSYQSSVIQALVLTSFMCLPPASQFHSSTFGVTVEPLPQQQQQLQQEVESNTAVSQDLALSEDFDGEDYDVGDDDEEEATAEAENQEDYNEPPAASALPVPEGLDSPAADFGGGGGGAFANWLGALAVKTSAPAAPIPPPPVAPAPVATTTMLTPADLFPNHPSVQPSAPIANASDGLPTSLPQQQQQPPPPSQPTQPQPNQNQSNNNNTSSNHNKKGKYNRKGKSRSRSPNQNFGKQNGGKGQQQQQLLAPGQDVTILQRKSDASASPGLAPPPGMVPTGGVGGVATTKTDLSAAQFQQQQAAIASEIQKAVQTEMKQTVIPLIDEKVRACVDSSIQPVLAAISTIGKDGVQVDHDKLVEAITAKVEAPLRAAFAENMKTVLIPAFQSVSGQMFSQISASLDNGMKQRDAAGADNGKLEEITSQLTNMTALVKHLASEVETLRGVVAESGGRDKAESVASSAAGATAAAEKAALEQEVLSFLRLRQYEAAFTKALSASTVEMALFVCSHADLADVLGGNSPSLSQPILLCLMHQLGTSVVTAANDENNLQTELAWLQEVSLSINPMDESMKRHLPQVLQQLVTGINDKMARTDQQARRPLQRLLQVLRGLQVQ